jgi:hypothetical protein
MLVYRIFSVYNALIEKDSPDGIILLTLESE